MTVSQKILQFYRSLAPPENLPLEVVVLNPYKDARAMELTTNFYQKYYNDTKERIILFGINPGRFGGGITGVPFSDPKHLQVNCDLQNPFDKRTELSSTFIYEMIDACGGPTKFYGKYYISAVSPLGFMANGKNLNYYDISNYKHLFEAHVRMWIEAQLAFPCSRQIAYCIGQGQNMKYLQALNKKFKFFQKIEALPHPRWVMQYRLKRKAQFINEYRSTLGF